MAVIAGKLIGASFKTMLDVYWHSLIRERYFLSRLPRCWHSATRPDTLGSMRRLASHSRKTGILYPFFGTLLSWIGVAPTGSDTASNALFGSLQCISSEQLGLTPALMGAANSSGAVMGKMIDAQSIEVVAR